VDDYEVLEEEVEGYEDTLAEVDRRLSDANAHLHSNTRELDVLEYSVDQDDTAEFETQTTGGAQHEHEHEDAHEEEAYEDDHHDQEEEDGDEEEEEETDDEDEEKEEPSSEAQGKERTQGATGAAGLSHVYENKFTKPVLKLGNTTVSVGEARLFGLLDKDGQVRLDAKKGKEHTRTRAEAKGAMDALVKKKDASQVKPEAEDEDAKECRFQPQRSKQAARAMRNPSCGYDFVSRLEERGGFMDRNGGHPAPKADDRSESAKEDYEASLDKLQCPKCRKYQSFDEYVEKRRSCGPCQERYVRLNVANMNSWKQRQEQAERKKQQRLKQIEDDFYGDASFAPKLNKKDGARGKRTLSLTERTEALMVKQKAEAQEAKAEKERERLAFEEKQRLQAAAARANRAAAKQQELAMLQSGAAATKKSGAGAGAGGRPKSGRGPGRESKGAGVGSNKLNRTAPASGLPHTGSSARAQKKREKEDRAAGSFNKTQDNISAKFDMLLN